MKRKSNSLYNNREGFSLVELIIVIAIMAILIGVIALAVLPNIQRSRESKDISALDNIASAVNAAIATTKAAGAGVIILGTTSTGVQDVSGFDSIADPTEKQKLIHSIYDSLPEGAGITESDSIGSSAKIAFAYDVPNRKLQVAYVDTVTESDSAYTALSPIQCEYIGQDYFVSSGG